jgi:hypothetical protein
MILLSFSVFLRLNELSQLRGNDVIVKDCDLIIKIQEVLAVLFAESTKFWTNALSVGSNLPHISCAHLIEYTGELTEL